AQPDAAGAAGPRRAAHGPALPGDDQGHARRLCRARCRQGARGLAARRGARRDVYEPLPRAPYLHDRGSPQHHRLHASAVHCQESRAHRRPHDQHRRDALFPRARDAAGAGAAQGRPLEPCRGARRRPARRGRRRGGERLMRPLVLVVEDEPALVTLLRYNLEREGFAVNEAHDGEEALLQLRESKPDAVLLDWMLPRISGLEICRQIRRAPAWRDLPVIMLTARGEETDRVRGLDSGADDYVVKPFSPGELIARLRAVIRRVRPVTTAETLRFGDIVMDLSAHRVSRANAPVHLGPTEFRLLRFFLERPGRVFSREQLLDGVWGRDAELELRTIDVHI